MNHRKIYYTTVWLVEAVGLYETVLCLFMPVRYLNFDKRDVGILLLSGAGRAVCRCQLSGVLQEDYGLDCVRTTPIL